MKKVILLPLLLLASLYLVAQNCTVPVLTTQAEINAFSTNYPGCQTVQGDLHIRGYGNSITSLSGLAQITTVSGNLTVEGVEATDLSGLQNIAQVGGSVGIYFNDNLTDLTGLTQLVSIGQYLAITDNPAMSDLGGLMSLADVAELFVLRNPVLDDFDGMQGLFQLTGGLLVEANPALSSLDGLDNLSEVGDYLVLRGNDALNDLTALGNLEKVGGDFVVESMEALTSLAALNSLDSVGDGVFINENLALADIDGLGGLDSIPGELSIFNNPKLIDLDGLAQITKVGAYLLIQDNPMLQNLEGLAKLSDVQQQLYLLNNDVLTNIDGLANLYLGGLSEVYIQDNDALSDCQVSSFCNTISNGDTTMIFIGANGPTCSSLNDVKTQCASGVILPVEWLSFVASANAEGVELQWVTATETHNQGFEVTRSIDGKEWQALGFVGGVGNSKENQAYSFIDQAPQAGTNYYRLRQLDSNGGVEYSETVSVTFNYAQPVVNIFPNPTAGAITVRTHSEQPAKLWITDITGRTVTQQGFLQETQVDLSDQQTGIYLLKMQIGREVYSQRIIKQ